MFSLKTSALVAAATALVGCEGFVITSDHDPSADFSALRTFAWSPDPPYISGDARVTDPDVHDMIRGAISAQLPAHGIAETANDPDLWVNYSLILETTTDLRTLNDFHDYPFVGVDFSRATELGFGSGATYVHELTEGTLVLDFVEPESRKLLWRASAQTSVHENPSDERRRTRINNALKRMLRHYPPK